MSNTGFLGGADTPTLVVVFLRGGADGLNMVVPVEDDGYYAARPQIGVPKRETVPLDGFFALHPRLAPLRRLYDDGTLTLVHGAGSEDTTRSHFEAQDFMEHGGAVAGGWLGRYLRLRPNTGGPLAAVAIGKTPPEALRGAPASVALESFEDFAVPAGFRELRGGLERLYRREGGNLGAAGCDTLDALDRVETMRKTPYRPRDGAAYPADAFGRGLLQIARLIKARTGLEAACIDLDGWDSHFAQATLMNPLMESLATGLLAFRQDLGPDLARTTVVVMSEFGRRVRENASFGTDHGRGGVMFVLGGGIRGGRIIAPWEGLREGALEGPGDLPVRINYRDVLSPILLRHGPAPLDRVFPGHAVRSLDL